jgi:DNA-binding CsgD family transcriptional regulator
MVCAQLIVDDLVRYLRAGVSVNLVGMSGSGRSTALDAAARRLAELGSPVVRLHGIPLLSERPLLALAVSGVEIQSASSSVGIVNAVVALARALGGPRSVLVVDDADALDQLSMGAIQAARSRTSFTILAATRLPERQPQHLLQGVQPSVRLKLPPPRFDELHQMIHQLLPGTVSSATVARIATLTGGLPGLVNAVIDAARRTGALRLVDGTWQVEGLLYSERLTEIVEEMLDGIGAEEVFELTELALLGSVPVRDAFRLIGRERVGVLEDTGLLQLSGGDLSPIAAVYPPLVGEYLRRECNASMRQRILAQMQQSGTGDIRHIAKHVCLRKRNPEGDSALLSHRIREYWLTEALLRRQAFDADPTPEQAVPLLGALHAASAPLDELREVIAATNPGDEGSTWRLRLAIWEAVQLASTDLKAALQVLDEDSFPEHQLWVSAARAHLRCFEDRVEKLPDASGPEHAVWELVRAENQLAAGQVQLALETLAAEPPEHPHMAGYAQLLRSLAYLLDGQVEAATELSAAQLARAEAELEPGMILANGYVQVLCLALTGDFAQLDAVTSTILTISGETRVFEHFQLGLITLAAICAYWDGRDGYAQNLAKQAQEYPKLGPFPAMLAKVAPSAVSALDERGEELWQAAADRLRRGYVAAGVFAAAAAIEASTNLKVAHSAHKAGENSQSVLIQLLSRYVLAAAQHDVDELRQVVAELQRLGFAIPAFRAGVRLAIAMRQAGDLTGAAATATRTWADDAVEERVKVTLFAPYVKAVDLSTREVEIAQMVAADLAGNEIATELNLSIHTVQNHIANIYRKMGISSRGALQTAMRTWLAGGE